MQHSRNNNNNNNHFLPLWRETLHRQTNDMHSGAHRVHEW